MKIEIVGVPLAKQSFKYTFSGRKYADKQVVDWCSQARMQIVQQLPKDWKPSVGPVFIDYIEFIFPPIKSLPKKTRAIIDQGMPIFKVTKPDLDNLQKNLFDACKGVLFEDDAQICGIGRIQKFYGNRPRIELYLV